MRQHFIRAMNPVIACLVLAGCAHMNSKTGLALAAAPLADIPAFQPNCGYPARDGSPFKGCSDYQRTHLLATDSQVKCTAFVTRLFEAAASTNTSLDIVNGLLTAAAGVTTPIRDAHLLSAGGTFVSGAKLSISNEYLNSLSLSHIIQAVQQTYGTDMSKYLAELDDPKKVDPAKVDYFAESSRIQAIHAECSLASAEGSIAATLQNTAPQQKETTHTAPTTSPAPPPPSQSDRTPPATPGSAIGK